MKKHRRVTITYTAEIRGEYTCTFRSTDERENVTIAKSAVEDLEEQLMELAGEYDTYELNIEEVGVGHSGEITSEVIDLDEIEDNV